MSQDFELKAHGDAGEVRALLTIGDTVRVAPDITLPEAKRALEEAGKTINRLCRIRNRWVLSVDDAGWAGKPAELDLAQGIRSYPEGDPGVLAERDAEITRLKQLHKTAYELIMNAYGFTSGDLNTRIATYIKENREFQ